MDKDRFWTTDRLLPRVSVTSPPFSSAGNGVPLSRLENERASRCFGEKIYLKGSKVILFYQLSEKAEPNDEAILEEKSFAAPPRFVPCALFSPSYAALNQEQKDYFLYFCQSIKEKQKVFTSFPYIQLYLARYLRKKEHYFTVSREIFWVWKNYRKDFPLIDKLFSDFISDLCFYLQIALPYEDLSDIFSLPDFSIRPFICNQYVFDYLFSEGHKISTKEKEFILRILTHQSFRNAKAYRHHKTFAYLVEEVIDKAFDKGVFNRPDLNDTLLGIRIPSSVKTVRGLFAGLCSEEVPNVEICLEYMPLIHDENIRDRCDEIVRYLENRIRAILKIKNCLSRIHVSPKHKAFLEGLLIEYERYAPENSTDTLISKQSGEKTEQMRPRELEIDITKANQIETESRSLARLLTEEQTDDLSEIVTLGISEESPFSASKDVSIDEALAEKTASPESDYWEFAASLTEDEDTFVRIALWKGKSEARKFALSCGAFFEAMLASCNEKAQNATGDGIFEQNGDSYPEYVELLKEVFPPMEGERS